jgi:DNA-binding response OmpR family regulator
MNKILLVEDTKTLGKNIKHYLELKNYEIIFVMSAEEAQEKIKSEHDISLILLDIHLPWMSGTDFLISLREKGNSIPVIFLTSKDSDEDIVQGLRMGADDYISKPFDYEVLIARIENIIRRNQNTQKSDTTITLGKYKIFPEKEQILNMHTQGYIYLPHLEFKLLVYIISQKGKICDRKSIYEVVWGEFENYYFSRTVDVYIGYLRKKLGDNIILTRKGSGYYLNENYD